jgi:TadE-like protein
MMNIIGGLHVRLRRSLGRRAVAAVEFAMIMPFILILFMGTIEVSTLYRTSAKLNAVAFNVAQMVSLTQSVKTASSGVGYASLTDICNGAVIGLAPFPAAGMTIKIASITQEASPNGLPKSSPAYSAAGPTYDEWEADSTVAANGTCSAPTGADAILTGTGPSAPITLAMTGTNAMLDVPCDNVIIVQVSQTYPGILGVVLTTRPPLTQTAYMRWANTTTTSELSCLDCTLVPPAATQANQKICTSTNTLATN